MPILLVEDDHRIGESLHRALEGTGYPCTWAQTGEEALRVAADAAPALVLLDLGLPDRDGLDVCRQIHLGDRTVPIIILTARGEEIDIVVGLDAGAVDYVTKPFKLAELLARIRAQLRRLPPPDLPHHEDDDVRIDTAARRVWLQGRELELRPKEFDLLTRLAADAGRAVTRETLMSDVWDEHWYGSTKTLDFHVASLRRKLDQPGRPSRITTLRGVGYRYEAGPGR